MQELLCTLATNPATLPHLAIAAAIIAACIGATILSRML